MVYGQAVATLTTVGCMELTLQLMCDQYGLIIGRVDWNIDRKCKATGPFNDTVRVMLHGNPP